MGPVYVRVVGSPVLALRESDFVRAGRVLGYSRARLLFRHILPNVTGVIAVQTSLALAWAILAEASLSFLGLGPPPPTASLGEMVSNASSIASVAWWTLAGPSLVIVIAVIGFNFLGDGLRDASDPRTRTTNMRVIGMISGTSFDAIEAVALNFTLENQTARRRVARTSLGALRLRAPPPYRCVLPPAAHDHGRSLPARHLDRAELRRRRGRACRRAFWWRARRRVLTRPDGLSLGGRGSRARHPAARTGRVDRRAHRCDRRR